MSEYKNTLRWVEPFGGWSKDTEDTGLCNRIFHWEVAYDISKNNNFDYQIILEEKYWPEFKLIDLPKTKFFTNIEGDSYDVEKLKFIAVYDTVNQEIKTAEPISYGMIRQMFGYDSCKLENGGHYYSNFGYRSLSDLYPISTVEMMDRPLKEIKLRYKSVEESIKYEVRDAVGIHIRRGNGIPFNHDDLNSLPEEIRGNFELIKRIPRYQTDNFYSFHQDELYFNIMDNILKLNPNQKFYISSDLPDEIMRYFYEKYGDNLIDKKNILKIVYDYIITSGIKKSELEYGNVVPNLVDLFSLSFCKFLIKVPTSTWSNFAENYVRKESAFVTEDWKIIEKKYIKAFKNV
jgi:hypothetical protein